MPVVLEANPADALSREMLDRILQLMTDGPDLERIREEVRRRQGQARPQHSNGESDRPPIPNASTDLGHEAMRTASSATEEAAPSSVRRPGDVSTRSHDFDLSHVIVLSFAYNIAIMTLGVALAATGMISDQFAGGNPLIFIPIGVILAWLTEAVRSS